MEEKRPGQDPEAKQRSTEQNVTLRAAPGRSGPPRDARERDLIEEAQARADDDREALRDGGHGDHAGIEGN